ncbi:TPA: hypothetical protein PXO92_002929 [Yersinia enterocolitica]|nr:hypothetical protein [Yersinia enterocolitica]
MVINTNFNSESASVDTAICRNVTSGSNSSTEDSTNQGIKTKVINNAESKSINNPPKEDKGAKVTDNLGARIFKNYQDNRTVWLTIVLCSVATALTWLIVLHFILQSDFYKNIFFAKDYVLKKPDQQFDPLMMHNIGEMVANGTLLSVDDFWSFQSSIYQTIITFLIALNGIIAAFSFLIIKTSSNAKARAEAREEAVAEIQKYLDSSTFIDQVKRVVRNKVDANLSEMVRTFQFDLDSKTDVIADQIDAIAQLRNELKLDADTIDRINKEHEDFGRYITILSKNASFADREEEDGANLVLGEK